MKPLRRFAACAWTSPNTAIGLLLALLAKLTGGDARVVTGVFETHGGLVTALLRRMPTTGTFRRPAGASALTLGHVVLGVDAAALDRTRTHERVHVRQYERWGPLFLPAYAIASLIAWRRGRHAYLDNRFEREAYAVSDGESA
ncbi:MAG: hypothetical protein AAF800_08480 [Planctomycetota bacterium]